jgi:hypothetical protein
VQWAFLDLLALLVVLLETPLLVETLLGLQQQALNLRLKKWVKPVI